MRERLRRIGFGLSIVLVLVLIYFMFYAEEGVQQSVFEHSLNLMGQTLLAMVPDGAGKAELARLYDDFKQSALQEEISPRQVELVAANILNLRARQEQLSAEQAERILLVAFQSGGTSASPAPPQEKPPPPDTINPRKWQDLGERISQMFEANEALRETIQEQVKQQTELARQFHFEVQDGLRLKLDTRLKTELSGKSLKELEERLRALQEENLVQWQEDLAEELEREMETLEEEMEALELSEQQAEQALRELRRLRHLPMPPVVDADSIRSLVYRSLSAAGLPDSVRIIVRRSLREAGLRDSLRVVIEKSLKEAGLPPPPKPPKEENN